MTHEEKRAMRNKMEADLTPLTEQLLRAAAKHEARAVVLVFSELGGLGCFSRERQEAVTSMVAQAARVLARLRPEMTTAHAPVRDVEKGGTE